MPERFEEQQDAKGRTKLVPIYRWLYRTPKGPDGKRGSAILYAPRRELAWDQARDVAREVSAEPGSFAELLDEYLEHRRWLGRANVQTLAHYRLAIHKHCKPLLNKQASRITRDDITQVLRAARLSPRSSNYLADRLKSIFAYAAEEKDNWAVANPVRRSHGARDETRALGRSGSRRLTPSSTDLPAGRTASQRHSSRPRSGMRTARRPAPRWR